MNFLSPRPRRVFPVNRGFTLIELLVVIAIIALLAAILFPVFGRARENARRSTCASNLKQIGLAIAQYTQDFDEMYPIDAGNEDSAFSTTIIFSTFSWTGKIQPYLQSRQVFVCPSAIRNPAAGNPPTGNAGTTVEQSLSYWIPSSMFIKYNQANDFSDYDPIAVASITKPTEIPHVYENLNGYYEARRIARPVWNSGSLNATYRASGSFDIAKAGMHFEGINTLYVDGHVKWKTKRDLYLQLCPQWTAANKGDPISGCTPASKI